ncbi:MAG: hypothetical protein J5606_07060 [Bacteroidales bacterium]|nr:hypothetical protein [Bacteroidales bacterium]
MNITREQIGTLHEQITITFVPEDYQPAVNKSLKDLKNKIQEPGFRKGHIPMGLVNKKYGKSVLVDELSKMTNDKMLDFFKENNINILFEPIEKLDTTVGDFDNPKDFTFTFEIGIRPELSIDYVKAKKIDTYKIIATDEEINTEIHSLRKRLGKFASTEEVAEEDMLLTTVQPEEGEKFTSSLMLTYVKEDQVKQFVGKKLHDEFTIDTTTVFKSDYERSTFLKVKMDELENAPKKVTIKIDAIHHMEPAELNEEFFSKAFPDGSVKDESALKENVKNQIELRYVNDANMVYRNKIMDFLVDNTTAELPDNFIKTYLVRNDNRYNAENIEEQYDNLRKSILFQLLEDKISQDCQINIDKDAVLNYIKDYIRMSYFGSMTEMDKEQEEQIMRLTTEMMKNQENVKNAYENLFFEKLTEGLKQQINPKTKEIDYQSFIKEVTQTIEDKPKKAKVTKTAKAKAQEATNNSEQLSLDL